MNIEEVRNFCLSLPLATERCPFGPDVLALELAGRSFCLLELSGKWDFYNLKVSPDYGVELCERYADIFPGFHMNKRHWISVRFQGDVPDKLQRELITHSYNQVVKALSKKLRLQLGVTELQNVATIIGQQDSFGPPGS